MSAEISWVLEVEILPGQLENFRAMAKELIASARTEPGTLAYEWHLNDAGTLCHIFREIPRFRRACDPCPGIWPGGGSLSASLPPGTV
ncbi:MAG: hypothetical protein LV481_00315 [Methylacidiphilales bacterium]|nr:hypothetical protein [Candidatus Methylacidiphilales bacterium]